MNKNLTTEFVALAVRVLADKTTLIRKPDTIETLFTAFMGGKSYDRRLAEELVAEATKAVTAVKRANTKRKFKLIVNNNY